MEILRPHDNAHWTIERLHQLPTDRNRYELVDGELLATPPPSVAHQLVSEAIADILRSYVKANGLGTVFVAPNEIQFARTQEAVEPDIMVVPETEFAAGQTWHELPRPILVVEILSPSSRRHDLVTKRRLYLREGIPEYWMVDAEAQEIRVARPGEEDRVCGARLEWQPKAEVAPLVMEVRSLAP